MFKREHPLQKCNGIFNLAVRVDYPKKALFDESLKLSVELIELRKIHSFLLTKAKYLIHFHFLKSSSQTNEQIVITQDPMRCLQIVGSQIPYRTY